MCLHEDPAGSVDASDWDADALAAFVAHAATAGPSEQQGSKRPRGAGSKRPGGGKAPKEAKAGRG